MKSWKNTVSKLVLALIVMVSFFSFQSSTYAATTTTQITQVGQPLPAPDPGWKRYEETASGFVFEGPAWLVPTSGNYSGSEKFTMNASLHSVKFSFFGTSLRLTSYRGGDRHSLVTVNIDGINYTYSAKGAAQITTLLFEKNNLENKVHTVVVSAVNSSSSNLFEFDALDINETGYLVSSQVISPTNLTANPGDSKVNLSWEASSNATSYNVKQSTTAGGPYETIVTNVTGTVYTDATVINATTYYYVVTALNANGQSNYSNEVSAKPQGLVVPDPEPSGDRAVLTITLTTGIEKEFDLSIVEVNAFLKWYDTKDAGSGPAKFAIDKHSNNKGPFAKRTEYVIFDKILTFEVSEYSTKK